MKSLVSAMAAAVGAALMAAPAPAQEYPSRPVTIVVPLTSGTTVDVIARIYSDAVAKRLGQSVVVLNKAGAGGVIAAQAVAQAAPDGYTILMANSGHAINGVLSKNLPYDAVADFAGIAMVGETPALVVVSPALGVKSLKEFVALAKSKPGAMNYGSGGIGSATHLAGAYFLAAAGIDMVHIPYKNSSELLSDMVTGRVEASFVPTAFVLSLLKDSKLQALAVAAEQPQSEPFPAPTARSQGVDYIYSTWYGFLAPAKTPAPVMKKLSDAFVEASADAEVQRKVRAQGIAPKLKPGRAFDEHIRADMKRLDPVLKDIASKMD